MSFLLAHSTLRSCAFILLSYWSIPVAAQPSQILSGRVMGYLANPVGDYDGLRLLTVKGTVQLRFPPHAAAQVLKLATVGQIVMATVAGQPRPPNQSLEVTQSTAVYRLVDLQNQQSKTGVHLADMRPPVPAPGKLVNTEGPLTSELRDDTGRLTALCTDQYIIDLKPHQGESVRALLTGAKRIRVVGYERTEPGFVNKTGKQLIHPTTLTINGQTFVL